MYTHTLCTHASHAHIYTLITYSDDEHFDSLLLGRFTDNGNKLTDIHDGKAYKQHMNEGGFLRNPLNISLIMNIDGVPIFKSSNTSLWPVYFLVNELPPNLRYIYMRLNYY